MSRWAYYSPLWVGALLVLALNDSVRAGIPTLSPGVQWLIVALTAVIAGLQCQVLMVGAQGAFAQVLPVPRGKSIRGGPAVLAGWLLIGWVVLAAVARLLGSEEISVTAIGFGVASLVALVAALAVYIWHIPAAIEDFRSEDRLQ